MASLKVKVKNRRKKVYKIIFLTFSYPKVLHGAAHDGAEALCSVGRQAAVRHRMDHLNLKQGPGTRPRNKAQEQGPGTGYFVPPRFY